MGAKSSVEIVLLTFLTAAWERHIKKSVSLINLFLQKAFKSLYLGNSAVNFVDDS